MAATTSAPSGLPDILSLRHFASAGVRLGGRARIRADSGQDRGLGQARPTIIAEPKEPKRVLDFALPSDVEDHELSAPFEAARELGFDEPVGNRERARDVRFRIEVDVTQLV